MFYHKIKIVETQMQNKNLAYFPFLKDVKSKLQGSDIDLDIEKFQAILIYF